MKVTMIVENTEAGLAVVKKVKSSFRNYDDLYGVDRTNNIAVVWTGLVQSTAAQLASSVIADEPVLKITIERNERKE